MLLPAQAAHAFAMLRSSFLMSPFLLLLLLLLTLFSPSSAELAVIGAGWGRTGTMSLKVALDQLGYKTYHMVEVIENNAHHKAMWTEASRRHLKGEPVGDLLTKILENYTAAVDFPVAAWWRELHHLNPKAKLILSVREPEKWYESAKMTILRHSWFMKALDRISDENQPLVPVPSAFWDRVIGEGRLENITRAEIIEEYNKNVRDFREFKLPEDQKLELKVGKDGWEPLCKFLDVGDSCPKEPFPRVNDRSDFQFRIVLPIIIRAITNSKLLLGAVVMALAALLYVVRSLLRKVVGRREKRE
eukprot:751388-Hanusia_phi.AAC.4